MSATAAPARIPSPMPSPVATVGFVDAMKTCPIPPVANTTVGARIAPTPPICPPHDVQCHTLGAPQIVLQEIKNQRVFDHLEALTDFGDQRPQDFRAGRIPAGVGDPVGMVSPSRVRAMSPSGVRSNSAPQPMSRLTAAGPDFDQDPHRIRITQTGPGHERVVHVACGLSRHRAQPRSRPAPTGSIPPRPATWSPPRRSGRHARP